MSAPTHSPSTWLFLDVTMSSSTPRPTPRPTPPPPTRSSPVVDVSWTWRMWRREGGTCCGCGTRSPPPAPSPTRSPWHRQTRSSAPCSPSPCLPDATEQAEAVVNAAPHVQWTTTHILWAGDAANKSLPPCCCRLHHGVEMSASGQLTTSAWNTSQWYAHSLRRSTHTAHTNTTQQTHTHLNAHDTNTHTPFLSLSLSLPSTISD
mmetsp:Transcript_11008/g.25691  ORF Transcript_11008/g.25691 Transcript_11008/m.25691 type:complete len:205 (+) Transcript_11008:673-1287(+)